MCGICGIAAPDGATYRQTISNMITVMEHRGPDAQGIWEDQGICLGHCRLAIVGLGETGNQPMSNEDASIWIVFNGEIYNFVELRKDLIRLGHKFKSMTDTEVVIHLYEQYGKDCLSHLRGMFAFAIWDKNERTLFVARDRLGIKPLYYTFDGSRFAFSSEVRPFIKAGLVPREVNAKGAIGFFSTGSVPQPYTMVKNIEALLPGHWLEYKDRKLRIEKYWRLSFNPKEQTSREDARLEMRSSLEDSVKSHLISEVPLGAFLSGGIDSSIVVALMRQFATGRLKTFNITFPEVSFSEAQYARLIATRFETEHTEYEIGCDQLKEELGNFIQAIDQPSMDGVNTFFVSKVTRECGIVVALTGLGGDELFCGYDSFKDIPRLYWGLTPLRIAPQGVRNILYKILSRNNAGIFRQKLASLMPSSFSLEEIYAAYKASFADGNLSNLIKTDVWDSLDASFIMDYICESHRAEKGADFTDRIASLELTSYVSNQLLRDTDAVSMAHSLEVRVPYLDHQFVDKVTHLPSHLRRKNGNVPKALLVESMGELLSPEVVQRRKQGFNFPLDPWMRQGLKPVISEVLSPENVRRVGVLEPDAVESLWKRFLAGERALDWSRVWMPFIFQMWCTEVLHV
ncbi:asparagine synthase (glutamine-hydrolyzing) [Chloroflexota bacterium]